MSRAFRNGERDFVKDEIVFVVDELDNIFDILLGKISGYYGFGEYSIDLYTIPEIKENINSDLKVNIGEDAIIKEWILEGILVLRSSIEDYRRKRPGSPEHVVEYKDNIFHTWGDAIKEFNKRKQAKEANAERRSKMTEYQLCREDNTVYLKNHHLSDEEISKCLNLIDKNDSIPSMEDIDIRCFGNEVQWKNGLKWEKLINIVRPEEEKHSEKYYVNVYHIWDLDRKPVFRGYTNESPESIFEKYGDYTEYVMSIANKEWCIEKGLEVPCGYKNGVTFDENGESKDILITQYSAEHGRFELVDGQLWNFDMFIDYKHSVNGAWISVLSNTKLNDQEIREWFSKRIGKVTGKFEKLFQEKIQDLEVKRWEQICKNMLHRM